MDDPTRPHRADDATDDDTDLLPKLPKPLALPDWDLADENELAPTRLAKPPERAVPPPSHGELTVPAPAHVYAPPINNYLPYSPVIESPAPVAPPYGQAQYGAYEPYESYPQPPVQPPLEAVSPAPAYTPRQNWAFVLFALMAVSLTVLFGVIVMVGIRLISNGRMTAGAAGPTETAVVQSEPTAILPTPTLGLEIQPWNGNERFTILLMGLDKRPNENGTAFRTDSMILVSIDPLTNSVGMLSIPRDLYIEIPPDTVVGNGYGLQRVNSAYVIGELARPGYGPQLAMQTVQYNLGIRVNDYFVFDFNTVIDGINAIGGIEVDVTEAINDPDYPSMNYGYEPLYIPTGRIQMDGALALKYARSRHNSSDVDRARRQQQVIMTVRAKILNLNMIPELVVQAPGLWSNLSRNIRAGLSFDQLLQLAVYLKDIPRENVKQGVIDYRYVIPTNWDGASVLIPNRASLGSLMVEVFGAGYNR